jgi:hypothetical protein
MQRSHVIFFLSLIPLLSTSEKGIGGDMMHFMLRGDYGSMALGTVIATNGNTLKFRNEIIIRGKALPSQITLQKGATYGKPQKHDLAVGAFAVTFIAQQGNKYHTQYGMWEVSSLDVRTLDLKYPYFSPTEQAMFQWYMNSGGRDNQFMYAEGGRLAVKRCDDTIVILPTSRENVLTPRPQPLSPYSHLRCWCNLTVNSTPLWLKVVGGGAILSVLALAYSMIQRVRSRTGTLS